MRARYLLIALAICLLGPYAAGETSCDVPADATLAQQTRCLSGKDSRHAKILLSKAAQQRDAAAAYNLGVWHLRRDEPQLAKQAFKVAADNGNLMASTWLHELNSKVRRRDQASEVQRSLVLAILSDNTALLDRLWRDHKETVSHLANLDPLQIAIESSRSRAADWLIRHQMEGGKLEDKLALAINHRMESVSLSLIKRVHALGDIQQGGDTFLIMAIRRNQPNVVSALLAQGADPFIKGSDHRTALAYARSKSTPAISKSFMHAGYDLTRRPNGSQGEPDAVTAYLNRDFASATRLISKGLAAKPFRQLMSLATAAQDSKMLQHLVATHKFSLQDFPSIDKSPLWLATNLGEPTWGPLLDWQGMDTRVDGQGNNLLIHTIQQGDDALALRLIDRGFPLAVANVQGRTAWWYAADRGSTRLLAILSQHPHDADDADIYGQSPLMRAVLSGNTGAVKMLLAITNQVDGQTRSGNTPLMLASADKPEIVDLLLAHHADVGTRNKHSLTALMIAARTPCVKCAKLLIAAGANPNRKDSRGRNAFDQGLEPALAH